MSRRATAGPLRRWSGQAFDSLRSLRMTGVGKVRCFPTSPKPGDMGHPFSCGWMRREKAQAGPLRRRSGQVFDSPRSLRMTGVGRGSLLSHPRRSHPTDEDLSVGTPGSLPRLEWGTHFRADGCVAKSDRRSSSALLRAGFRLATLAQMTGVGRGSLLSHVSKTGRHGAPRFVRIDASGKKHKQILFGVGQGRLSTRYARSG